MKLRLNFLLVSIYILIIQIIKIYCNKSESNDKDPFRSLGIPDLNPKQLLEEIDNTNGKKKEKEGLPQLKSIDDLPNFLKNSKLNEEEGIKILTRFLIQDDFTLKKFGVVYDQSGFDGISPTERIGPVGTEDRLQQRSRSAANIWFKQKYPKLDYDAYGAEQMMDEIIPNWRIYKILMIGKNGENTFIKVCIPLDESMTALCSDKDEPCSNRSEYVEKEKKKNEDYIEKIKSNNFFKKSNLSGKVKLLPGEKIIAKEQGKELVIDSHSISSTGLNPPSVSNLNGDPLLNAFKNRNNGLNLQQQPNPNSFGQPFPGSTQSIQTPIQQNQGALQPLQTTLQMQGSLQSMPSIQGSIQPNQGMQNTQSSFPVINGVNPNFTINKGPGNLSVNGVQDGSAYNFKQKEMIQNSTQPPSPIDNSSLYNELMQMKSQLSQMMNTIKQKDEIITQQNLRLSQINTSNSMNQISQNYQQMPMNNINNMLPSQQLDQKTNNFLGYQNYNQILPQAPQFNTLPIGNLH